MSPWASTQIRPTRFFSRRKCAATPETLPGATVVAAEDHRQPTLGKDAADAPREHAAGGSDRVHVLGRLVAAAEGLDRRDLEVAQVLDVVEPRPLELPVEAR